MDFKQLSDLVRKKQMTCAKAKELKTLLEKDKKLENLRCYKTWNGQVLDLVAIQDGVNLKNESFFPCGNPFREKGCFPSQKIILERSIP
jgi:hypothetical protein